MRANRSSEFISQMTATSAEQTSAVAVTLTDARPDAEATVMPSSAIAVSAQGSTDVRFQFLLDIRPRNRSVEPDPWQISAFSMA
jgi:hypothetical protein